MPPRDDDKAMDGLLRRSLARGAAANACPEPDILAAYCERSLDLEELARYEPHFSECARCREQLAAIFRAGSVADIPVMQETMEAAVVAAPRTMALSSAAADAPKKQTRPGRFDWRWLAPVAAAILVVVFIYGRNASRLEKPQISGNQVAMTKPQAVPPSGLADREFDAQHQSRPLPTPPKRPAKDSGSANPAAPPVARDELPQLARNYPAAPPTRDLKANRVDELRSEYESRDDLKKRAETATSNNLEKSASSELDTFSAAKSNADSPPAAVAPPASPPRGAGAPTRAETKQSGTRAGAAGQKSIVGGMLNDKKQMETAAGASDTVTVTSQAVAVQSPAPVIQTPDAGVQYRIPAAGVVERSSDGGATWQGQRVKANAEILAGAAPSENVCWLVGRGGVILMTSDGKHWKKIPSPAVVDFVGVTAADASFATVTAADERKFSTQNGGLTWQLMK
jgi:hypothetical protein